MKTLDNEQMNNAINAVGILYRLGLIDMFIYEALIAKIHANTGE